MHKRRTDEAGAVKLLDSTDRAFAAAPELMQLLADLAKPSKP